MEFRPSNVLPVNYSFSPSSFPSDNDNVDEDKEAEIVVVVVVVLVLVLAVVVVLVLVPSAGSLSWFPCDILTVSSSVFFVEVDEGDFSTLLPSFPIFVIIALSNCDFFFA